MGFMGAGKSSVGRALAFRLGAEFVDVDSLIEAAAGRSIREIFASEGEEAFRERERAAIREAVDAPGRVIAAGGGAFVDPENRRLLKAYAPVFFLDVSPETVMKRIPADRSRPLLPGKEEARKLRDLMERRRPTYREADYTVSTDDRSVAEVADRILGLLSKASPAVQEGEGG